MVAKTVSLGSVLLGIGVIFAVLLGCACGYRYYVGPLEPVADQEQASGTRVEDDGTVTFVKERLEISVRPVTDEELNRQFAGYSREGLESTNPYTFGDWRDPETKSVPSRFTVFLLKVKNYTYPKMRVDPIKALIIADNGREYRPLSLLELEEYYAAYVVGYAGNKYARYQVRTDILRKSLYYGDVIFSGQEEEGFVAFPRFHEGVKRIRFRLEDVMLRFDVWDEPIETMDVEYLFQREIGRVYPGKEKGGLP
jgi:hypothetical protein